MKRNILLTILAIEGIGGIFGGIFLIASPDGYFMKMPVEIMHGVFPNFFIPGLLLAGMGLLNIFAFLSVFLRSHNAWLLVGLALVGYAIWFIVEIVILREVHWLHIVWGTPILIGIWTALPMILISHGRLAAGPGFEPE